MKKKPDIKSAERTLLRQGKHQGLYRGCFSETHWKSKRREHKWDLFAQYAPKLAKIHSEVPNSLRDILGIEVRKHTLGKFSQSEGGSHQCPEPLATALETLLLERIALGEECTADFAAHSLSTLIEVWNGKVGELHEAVREASAKELLREQDDAITEDMSLVEIEAIQIDANKKMEKILSDLRPVELSKNHSSFQTLPSNSMCIFSVYMNIQFGILCLYIYMFISYIYIYMCVFLVPVCS